MIIRPQEIVPTRTIRTEMGLLDGGVALDEIISLLLALKPGPKVYTLHAAPTSTSHNSVENHIQMTASSRRGGRSFLCERARRPGKDFTKKVFRVNLSSGGRKKSFNGWTTGRFHTQNCRQLLPPSPLLPPRASFQNSLKTFRKHQCDKNFHESSQIIHLELALKTL